MPSRPIIAATPDDVIGRHCPYCQTALAISDITSTCGDCNATHHHECWNENRGCAITGCESAPDPIANAAEPVEFSGIGGRIAITLDTYFGGPLRAARGAVPAARGTGVPAARRRRLPIAWIIGAILALAAIGGGAFALAGAGGPSEPTVGSADIDAAAPQQVSYVEGPVLAKQLQEQVRKYLTAIQAGKLEDAWPLLSARRRTAYGGLQTWKALQTKLGLPGHLVDAQKARVTIVSNKSSGGVAVADVQGVGWTAPSAACATFHGWIWARYEFGQWQLEPEQSGEQQPVKPYRNVTITDAAKKKTTKVIPTLPQETDPHVLGHGCGV